MTDLNDEQLAELVAEGHPDALRELISRHYTMMYKTAFKWCGKKEDAEDIAQDACVRVARYIGSYNNNSKLTTWLYRITINAAKDYYKSQMQHRKDQQDIDDTPGISDNNNTEQTYMARETLRVITSLPDKIKEAVILVFWEDMSHAEAADVLECAESTVSWRIHEARKILTLELQEEGRGHG